MTTRSIQRTRAQIAEWEAQGLTPRQILKRLQANAHSDTPQPPPKGQRVSLMVSQAFVEACERRHTSPTEVLRELSEGFAAGN